MVAYNFQAQFAVAVATGRKCQTIRAPRKDGRHAKPGDRLQLYTGMRTKSCRKLIDPDPICIRTCGITITQQGITYVSGGISPPPDEVARRDGFPDWPALTNWFDATYGLPFTVVLIEWKAAISSQS